MKINNKKRGGRTEGLPPVLRDEHGSSLAGRGAAVQLKGLESHHSSLRLSGAGLPGGSQKQQKIWSLTLHK